MPQRTSFLSRIPIGFLVLVGLAACLDKKATDETAGEEHFSMPLASEEVLISRCAPWLIDNPQDSSQRQHNEIVNIIIDKGWDLQLAENGTFYHIIRMGEGESIKWGDRLSVHYTGYDLQLNVFESSRMRNKPFVFYLGNVIKGWNDGLPLIKEGGRIILAIPAYKAYGEKGFTNLVGPDQHLIFDIEIIEKIAEQ